MRFIYHFNAEKPLEDVSLSSAHKLFGNVAQYLKNFQLEGVRFLYRHYEKNQGCILNDDSGLGKTLQVTAFLGAIFEQDLTKKCLIIVKDEVQVTNWKFHLDVFTKLRTKVVFNANDVCDENIYITKWNTILKTTSLHNLCFDYTIIDDRGNLLSNKICLNYFLKSYTNRVSLIIASIDVAVDLNMFHSILRLCGLLSKEHENLKKFEEKFSLPSCVGYYDKNILEAYFIRREKIINFCRDFRLRRYQHQFEDVLPLATPDQYENSIRRWKEIPLRASCSTSSELIKVVSSPDKDTEELFKSLSTSKEQHNLDKETSKVTSGSPVVPRFREDSEESEMSPLLFEPDSNDEENGEKEENVDIENVNQILQSKEKFTKKSSYESDESSIHQNQGRRLIRRSMPQKNKYLIPDISQIVKKRGNKLMLESICFDKRAHKPFRKSLSDDSKYNFGIDFTNKLTLQETQNTFEIDVLSPKEHVIVLSSSSEENKKNKLTGGNISPSPDLFTNADDYNITCSQKKSAKLLSCYRPKLFDSIKSEHSSHKNVKSCLVVLEKNFANRLGSNSQGKILEVAKEGDILKKNIQEASEPPLKSRAVKRQNQINYSTSSESSSNESNKTKTGKGKILQRRNSEFLKKTPKRQKLVLKSPTCVDKSKSVRSSNVTPNSFKKWLTTSKSTADSSKKCGRKRRLDICLKDL